jgi:4-hydroxy-tetrahydrodipicolinate synthase
LRFQGSICAIVSPFDASGCALDLGAFGRLLDWHRDAGTDGIVIAGSTGEWAALEPRELDQLVESARERTRGKLRLIVGCGAASTARTLQQVRHAEVLGAEAALVVTPYYVRPTQEGLYRHYMALAEAGSLPLILYNVPSRTGCDLLPETVARMAAHPQIVGIKEARGEPERMEALLPLRDAGFTVLSGDDPTAGRAMLGGADGVISVAANVCPRGLRQLCALARRGDPAAANVLDARLAPLYRVLGLEPNPIPVKWLLHRLGLAAPTLRLPLLELSEAQRADAESGVAIAVAVERELASVASAA